MTNRRSFTIITLKSLSLKLKVSAYRCRWNVGLTFKPGTFTSEYPSVYVVTPDKLKNWFYCRRQKNKMKYGLQTKILTTLIILLLSFGILTKAKILNECEAMRELQRGGISRTFMSNWICLMKNESGMNTQLITGPKGASNYYYGIFQISSSKWCTRGRIGGICNKRCEDFADDDIQDDIICAKKISNMDGFKAWNEWTKKCKNKPLPNIRNCQRRR